MGAGKMQSTGDDEGEESSWAHKHKGTPAVKEQDNMFKSWTLNVSSWWCADLNTE